MTDLNFVTSQSNPGRTDWKAVWAGTFIFYAIWAVFGTLGVAIFTSNATPTAGAPIVGQSVGMAIWAVILTIIAMYVAGRETARLAGAATRHEGLIHGLVMFGLAMVGVVALASLGGAAVTGGNTAVAGAHSPNAMTVVADLGWTGFVSLFLGWLAAMVGGASAVGDKSRVQSEPVQARPAA